MHCFNLTTNSSYALLSTLHSTLFSFFSASQAPVQLYPPYNCTAFRDDFKSEPKGPPKFLYKKKIKCPPQSHKFTNFTATPTCHNAKQPPIKITSTYKNLTVGTEVRAAHTEVRAAHTCYSNIIGTPESSRCIVQGVLWPRWLPNPAPQPSNNLRQLPRAVSLERSPHGVTRSKMLTNYHTVRHVNKEILVHVHYPSKLCKHIYNELTKKKIYQQLQNIKHKILLPRSFIHYTCTLSLVITCERVWFCGNTVLIVSFLLGSSQVSQFYTPTFRNTICSGHLQLHIK